MAAKNEYAYVSPLEAERGSIGLFRVSAAATLSGLETPPAGKNLEIKPYGISRLVTDFVGKPRLHNNVQKDGGVDVKYGVTKSLTADLTYRTDFAQVEEDEAQVNLTRVNLVFPEKRDFFLEGAGIFTPRLAIEPNVSLNWIDLQQRAFAKNVIGQRTLYSMTPRMFITALVQYASDTTSLSANIRFWWEYQPGSELFVVYTEGRTTALSALTPLENRGFVIKINKLMRF